jgi:hypothetical protein
MAKFYLAMFAFLVVSYAHCMEQTTFDFVDRWKANYYDILPSPEQNGLKELIIHFNTTYNTAVLYLGKKPFSLFSELSRISTNHNAVTEKYSNNIPVITGYNAFLQQAENNVFSFFLDRKQLPA